jgi:hypothetical protein
LASHSLGSTVRVFVCYTLRDSVVSRSWLIKLQDSLGAFCLPYIDLLHNDGPDYQESVVAALHNSDLLLACISPGFFSSPWVNLELSLAQRRRIPISPLLLTSRCRRFRGAACRSSPTAPAAGPEAAAPGRAQYVSSKSRLRGGATMLLTRPLAQPTVRSSCLCEMQSTPAKVEPQSSATLRHDLNAAGTAVCRSRGSIPTTAQAKRTYLDLTHACGLPASCSVAPIARETTDLSQVSAAGLETRLDSNGLGAATSDLRREVGTRLP